jgi:hypothetical protein
MKFTMSLTDNKGCFIISTTNLLQSLILFKKYINEHATWILYFCRHYIICNKTTFITITIETMTVLDFFHTIYVSYTNISVSV